jgi:hypothetical protein
MPNARTTSNSTAQQSKGISRVQSDVKDMQRDLVEYAMEYAKENPGHAALFCVGLGFILGWKLKPW